ncbi:MAG: tyrosine-type recombinase/integrase [Bdellovibrionales bacterium]|nr:tyrosine-type recombinase/integrase [Bdellovibrionales bacterium]
MVLDMGRDLAIKNVGVLGGTESSFGGYASQLEYEFFENFDSEHTRAAYKLDLCQFFQYVQVEFGPIKHPQQLHKMHVVGFRNTLQGSRLDGGGQPYCPKTIIRKLAAIASYCAFLIEKGLMTSNPAEHVKRPTDQVITPTSDLSDDQVKALLDSVDLNKRSGPLHMAVLVLLFSTGMRKGELINLKFTDYQEHQGLKIIQFVGKRGKVSRVPLHPAAIFHLENYIQYMRAIGRELTGTDYLFQGSPNRISLGSNKKLQGTSVDYIIKYHCQKIGIKTKITPHSARATVIGSLLEGGCDLYKVSQLVNHSNVKTTQSYDKRRKSLIDSPVFKLKYF